ncbi:hypothetical protein A2U01_0062948, partial [Trifolium medium]|nr:hypothetical protein [Trifolium medium]
MNCATRRDQRRSTSTLPNTAQRVILLGAKRLNQNQNSLSCTAGSTRHGPAPLAQLADQTSIKTP